MLGCFLRCSTSCVSDSRVRQERRKARAGFEPEAHKWQNMTCLHLAELVTVLITASFEVNEMHSERLLHPHVKENLPLYTTHGTNTQHPHAYICMVKGRHGERRWYSLTHLQSHSLPASLSLRRVYPGECRWLLVSRGTVAAGCGSCLSLSA